MFLVSLQGWFASPGAKEVIKPGCGLVGKADVERVGQWWAQRDPEVAVLCLSTAGWLCVVQHVHGFRFMLSLLTRKANDEKIPLTFLSDWNTPLPPMSSAI